MAGKPTGRGQGRLMVLTFLVTRDLYLGLNLDPGDFSVPYLELVLLENA
jgi:hypothetical protein